MHDDFRNRLIWGDNKLVMASLIKEFRGKIDLIYIEPDVMGLHQDQSLR